MHVKDLLKINLKNELLNELSKLYKQNNLNYNKKLFKKICSKKIDSKLDTIIFLNEDNKYIYTIKNCKARIWDNHYGSRCRYLSLQNEEYCKHHLNMINKYGSLRFNRYDEEKPIKNEKGNIIPWFTKCHIDIINDIIQKNHINISNNIHKYLCKNRQITPKF